LRRPARVPVSKLLLGGEHGASAAEHALRVDDLARPSTPVADWPHTRLLLEWEADGEAALDPERLLRSDYVANGRVVVDTYGDYFGATDDDGLVTLAERFVRRHAGLPAGGPPASGVSTPGEPVVVREIRWSDCYQVVDGHHRVASAYVHGA